MTLTAGQPNAWLQRRGANSRKLRRRKYHEKDATAASAASLRYTSMQNQTLNLEIIVSA